MDDISKIALGVMYIFSLVVILFSKDYKDARPAIVCALSTLALLLKIF